MRPFTIALAALAFSSAPAFAQAGTGTGGADITGSGSRTTGIPGSAAGDVSSGTGASNSDQPRAGDRRTLDDIKAGTSGSTQAR